VISGALWGASACKNMGETVRKLDGRGEKTRNWTPGEKKYYEVARREERVGPTSGNFREPRIISHTMSGRRT